MGKNMKINEVAKLTGITVRTLHYYDEIGLLKPSNITEAGYRLYDNKSLEKLQQILFFRELDFPLIEIKEIISNPNYDDRQALTKHKELLVKKKQRLEGLVNLVDKILEGGNTMSFNEFDMTEIEKMKDQYSKEVKERWGDTNAYKESENKTKNLNSEQWEQLTKESNLIFEEFSINIKENPDSQIARQLVKKWQNYITQNFYNCTNEILLGLSYMYVEDERFKKNIDKYGEGTAEFMSKAIKLYCKK